MSPDDIEEQPAHIISAEIRAVRRKAEIRAARRKALADMAALCDDVAEQETIRTTGIWTTGEYQMGARNCAEAIRLRARAEEEENDVS
jgi:hypothetical protein